MQMKRSPKKAYMDGLAIICTENPERIDDYGGGINAQSMDDLEVVCKLRYNLRTARQEDLQMADLMGEQLSLKICVPHAPSVAAGMEAVIGGTLYHIYRADPDQKEKELYLYLAEVRRLA